MSTLSEPLCRKAGSGSASRFWEKRSSRAKVITGCTTDFTFHHCPAHCWKMALEQKFRKRHQHKWGHCSHPGTRGSHGHRSGDTECLSLLTSVSGCHLSEAFCCFSFAHTANTKLNRIYATSLKILVFNPVKNIHMSFFPSLLLKYPQSRNVSNIHYKVIIPLYGYWKALNCSKQDFKQIAQDGTWDQGPKPLLQER